MTSLLRCAESNYPWMGRYFDAKDRFLLDRFRADLLTEVGRCVEAAFGEGSKVPKRIRTNGLVKVDTDCESCRNEAEVRGV